MSRIEPHLVPVLSDLVRGLREIGVDFCVVGALVPELLLDARPHSFTNDADVTVAVESLAAFEHLKDSLADFGFERTSSPHRMRHRDGGLVDLLPFSNAIAPTGYLNLGQNAVLNMAGFDYAVPSAVQVSIEPGIMVPLVPVPLYVLLKLVAYGARKEPKDLVNVHHCLQHYMEDDERRYGLDHQGEIVPFDYTSAYLLGLDGRRFDDPRLNQAVRAVLDRFSDPDAEVVGVVARGGERLIIEAERRVEIFRRFRWFHHGRTG